MYLCTKFKSHILSDIAIWSMNNKKVLPRRKWEFNEEIPEGMKEEFCPVCQLTLSSRIVAISHYKGKLSYVKKIKCKLKI